MKLQPAASKLSLAQRVETASLAFFKQKHKIFLPVTEMFTNREL